MVYMGIYGHGESWGIMGNYGALWGFMVLWDFMGFYGELWGTMGSSGELWVIMGNYGGKSGCVCNTSREDFHSHGFMSNGHGWRNKTVHH